MAVVRKEKGAIEKKPKEKRRRDRDDDESFSLPTERTEPVDDLGAYTWLIYGLKKIGKTSLTSKFGKALHAFTEPGGKALRLYPVAIKNWRMFRKMIRALEKGAKFNTVVVDIVDNLHQFSEDYVCEKLVIQNLADEEWGKGWAEHRKEFEREITRLLNLGIGVIFISHAQEREVEDRDGTKHDMILPTMHKRMREQIEGVVDIWAYYGYAGKRRVLQILGDDRVSAGHRLEGRFMTPDGRPIRRIDMGTSADEGYRNIVSAFHNKFEPPKRSDIDLPEEEEKKTKKKKKLRK